MAGIKNSTLCAKNADYTQADSPNANSSESNGLVTNGKMWIGSTATNAGGTHINVGSITSPLGTLAIGYSTPNITMDVVSSMVDLHVAKLIVNSTPNAGGNYNTITAALAAASSGDTIFVMPGATGTYTENLTLKAGVNITAFDCDAQNPNVTIIGTLTATFAGSCSISGIRLQTNSAAVLVVSGASATTVKLIDCYLNLTNSSGITLSSSGGSNVYLLQCNGNLGTTGIHYFDVSGAGSVLWVFDGLYGNTGVSTSVSTISSNGGLISEYVDWYHAFTSSGTSTIQCEYCSFRNPSNVGVTVGGTGTTNTMHYVRVESGTATAITVGAGAALNTDFLSIDTSNVNALDGGGTIRFGEIVYSGSSSNNNVSTRTQYAESTRTVANGGTGLTSTTINQILYSSSNNVIAGLATANQGVLTTGATGIPVITALATNGQLIIGSTAGVPAAATLTAGTGISITNGSNSITIATSGGSLAWTDVTGATQTLAVENGYITDRGGGVTYTLPASGALGDVIRVVGKSGIAVITPNANQQILIGSVSGTVGVTGTATANNAGDCIELICTTSGASTVWRAASVVGTWTLA